MEKVHGAQDSQRQIEKGRPVGIVRLQKVTPILLHGKIQSIVQSMISTTEIEGGAYSLQPNSTQIKTQESLGSRHTQWFQLQSGTSNPPTPANSMGEHVREAITSSMGVVSCPFASNRKEQDARERSKPKTKAAEQARYGERKKQAARESA